MQLKIFKTLWGHSGNLEQAVDQAVEAGFHGIEGPVPVDKSKRQQFADSLMASDLGLIAEITTAGGYVPDRLASVEHHLDSLTDQLRVSCELEPEFITCLGGCDAWPESQSQEFFEKAIQLADQFDVVISFETHRSRSLFNPWVTQRMVERIDGLNLTVDFSHWCVVCERLMDSEVDVIHAIADHVQHIHGRVGYDQGPQVPDPRAPEYEYALRAHQSWWEIIWRSQHKRDFSETTITPEFGPDGYLHELPFSRQPVADLWELNQWMAQEEVRHFSRFELML